MEESQSSRSEATARTLPDREVFVDVGGILASCTCQAEMSISC
jgi:hypothetical protein